MILYYFWRFGLLSAADREKVSYFFGASEDRLALSRRWPLILSIHWGRALFSPRYARSVAEWLRYRAELYDGLQG